MHRRELTLRRSLNETGNHGRKSEVIGQASVVAPFAWQGSTDIRGAPQSRAADSPSGGYRSAEASELQTAGHRLSKDTVIGLVVADTQNSPRNDGNMGITPIFSRTPYVPGAACRERVPLIRPPQVVLPVAVNY
jgi:hypothetical protein